VIGPLVDCAPARDLLAQGRAAEALMAIEMALAHAGGDPEANALKAQILTVIAAMDPEFAKLELAAALHPDQPGPQFELGHAYAALDRPADAERCFKRALQLAPGSAEFHAALAALYLSVAMADAAEHYSRRALAIDPVHVVAAQTLASVLESRGEPGEAQALLERTYRRRALYLQRAAKPRRRVLVLATATSGNIPYQHIMPAQAYDRLVWYMEYAREDEQPSPEQYEVVFNTIGDADLADRSAPNVEGFLANCPRPLINRPEAVAHTRRDRLPALLAGLADVVVPHVVRLNAGQIQARGLAALAEEHGFDGPTLVRPIGSHGGKGLQRVEQVSDLEAVSLAPSVDHYLTEYIDCRSEHGLFPKYRVFFIDGRLFPYHLAIGSHWLVHHETSGMTAFAERRDEEKRFLENPEAALGTPAWTALQRIGERIGLDYGGIDFTVAPDGRVIVFEANATMLAHPEDPHGPYAHKNQFVMRIVDAFQAMLDDRATKPR
jgi:tetratricopeptide (TPR) repeat protein